MTLFSYVLLVDFYPWYVVYENAWFGVGIWEIIVHIWTWSLIIEEGHKVNEREREMNELRDSSVCLIVDLFD